jgi:hypothetical protein
MHRQPLRRQPAWKQLEALQNAEWLRREVRLRAIALASRPSSAYPNQSCGESPDVPGTRTTSEAAVVVGAADRRSSTRAISDLSHPGTHPFLGRAPAWTRRTRPIMPSASADYPGQRGDQ